jgi:hypothetical protein
MFPCQGGVQEATRAEKLCQDLPSDPESGVSVEPQVILVFWRFRIEILRCCLNLINFQYVQPQKNAVFRRRWLLQMLPSKRRPEWAGELDRSGIADVVLIVQRWEASNVITRSDDVNSCATLYSRCWIMEVNVMVLIGIVSIIFQNCLHGIPSKMASELWSMESMARLWPWITCSRSWMLWKSTETQWLAKSFGLDF